MASSDELIGFVRVFDNQKAHLEMPSSQLQRDDGSSSGHIDCALIGRSALIRVLVGIKCDLLKPISIQVLIGMALTTAPVSNSPFKESCLPCASSTRAARSASQPMWTASCSSKALCPIQRTLSFSGPM